MYPLSAISNRCPFAPAALPALDATMGTSDSQAPPPSSSLFTLVRGCAPYSGRRCLGLLGYRAISMSGSTRSKIPGGANTACRCNSARCPLLPADDSKPSAPSNAVISGLNHLQGRLYPLPLHLACLRTYASSATLPSPLQGSLPGPWLAATRAGLSPARIRGIAKPQPSLTPILRRLHSRHGRNTL